MSHTQGPWIFHPEDNIIETLAGRRILDFYPRSTHVSEAERNANGALIAAAPELLSACEQMETFLDITMPPPAWAAALTIVRAAITKARGLSTAALEKP